MDGEKDYNLSFLFSGAFNQIMLIGLNVDVEFVEFVGSQIRNVSSRRIQVPEIWDLIIYLQNPSVFSISFLKTPLFKQTDLNIMFIPAKLRS